MKNSNPLRELILAYAKEYHSGEIKPGWFRQYKHHATLKFRHILSGKIEHCIGRTDGTALSFGVVSEEIITEDRSQHNLFSTAVEE